MNVNNSQPNRSFLWTILGIIGLIVVGLFVWRTIVSFQTPTAVVLVQTPTPDVQATRYAAIEADNAAIKATMNAPKPTQVAPTAAPTRAPRATLAPTAQSTDCDGCAWKIDTSNKVLNWNGAGDGSRDIHEGTADSLALIRAGYSATFTTTVDGEIIMTVGLVNGKAMTTPSRMKVPAGTYTISNSVGESGGFRWTPLEGIGWRAKK